MNYLNSFLESLSNNFGSILPGVLGALLVLIIGLLVARLIKGLVIRLFKRTKWDERVSTRMNSEFKLDRFAAGLLYYLVVIYTLLLVLDMLGLNNVLAPLENLLNEFLGFLPNLIGAGIITFAGYMIAKLVSEATGFVSNTIESFGERAGWNSSLDLTKLVKQIVFIIIFIPIFIVALDTLNMKAISEPATEMLRSLLSAIPSILAALVTLGVVYLIGKYVVAILVQLLQNLGTDRLAANMGLDSVIGSMSLSKLLGNIAFFFIVFTGIIAAVNKLEMTAVSNILSEVFQISGRVFFGLIILAVGNFISSTAANAMSNSSKNAWLSSVARFAILGIFLAFALHTMGIADSIVNLAFGLTLGAVAVAFALAFGLGGREAAGKQLEHFFDQIRNKK